MPNILKSTFVIAATLLMTRGQYVNSALENSVDVDQGIVTASDQRDFAVSGDFVEPLILANGAELIDALSRGSAVLEETLFDLAPRDLGRVENATKTATEVAKYKFMDTERIHIFMWTGILLAITTYMGVMAFFNMPLKKDPLLYTKLYSSGTH